MQANLGLTDTQRAELQAYLANERDILQAWAFGSRAKGTACPHSDLDLTVRLADPDNDPDFEDEELQLLIQHSARWGSELTALLGIVVKDIYLEFDKGVIGGAGRREGVMLIDKIGRIADV